MAGKMSAVIRKLKILPDRLESLMINVDIEHYEQIASSLFRLKNLKDLHIVGVFLSPEFLYKWAVEIFEGISTLKNILIMRKEEGKYVIEYQFKRERCGREIPFKLKDYIQN